MTKFENSKGSMTTNPKVMNGKIVIKGTKITVALLLTTITKHDTCLSDIGDVLNIDSMLLIEVLSELAHSLNQCSVKASMSSKKLNDFERLNKEFNIF